MDSNGFPLDPNGSCDANRTRSRTPPSLASDPPICRHKKRPLVAMPGLPEDLTDHSLRQAVCSWSAVPRTSESALHIVLSAPLQKTMRTSVNIIETDYIYYIYTYLNMCVIVCVFLFLVFMLCSINVPSMFQMSDWVPWLHILLGTLCKSFQRR